MSKTRKIFIASASALIVCLALGFLLQDRRVQAQAATDSVLSDAQSMVLEGRRTFRFDTFGDEAFWGDALMLYLAVEGPAHGGVAPGVSPRTALALGLKVDVDALPPSIVQALQSGAVNLDDPAATLTLLRLNAVVGLTGFFNSSGTLRSIGIQCALCHSLVDNSFAPGIGHRLDDWANSGLNGGAIVGVATD